MKSALPLLLLLMGCKHDFDAEEPVLLTCDGTDVTPQITATNATCLGSGRDSQWSYVAVFRHFAGSARLQVLDTSASNGRSEEHQLLSFSYDPFSYENWCENGADPAAEFFPPRDTWGLELGVNSSVDEGTVDATSFHCADLSNLSFRVDVWIEGMSQTEQGANCAIWGRNPEVWAGLGCVDHNNL